MKVLFGRTEYNFVWQDRRDLDGSSIEITVRREGGEEEVARIFCNDHSAELFLTTFEPNIPVDVIEAAISRAKAELPEPPEG